MSVLVSVCLFILSAVNVYLYVEVGLIISLVAAMLTAFAGGLFLKESL